MAEFQTHEIKLRSYTMDDNQEVSLETRVEFFLDIDDKSYRIRVMPDGALGFALINGVDMKVTNPPAFHYPCPFVQITHK